MFQQDKHNLYITWKIKNSLLLCNQSFSFDTAEYPLHPEAVGFAMLTYILSEVLNDLNADILCWFLLSSEQRRKAVTSFLGTQMAASILFSRLICSGQQTGGPAQGEQAEGKPPWPLRGKAILVTGRGGL
jgi:hypothetical protein